MNQYAFLACNIPRPPLSPWRPSLPRPYHSLIFPSRFSLFYAREQLAERQECERKARLANAAPTQHTAGARSSREPVAFNRRLCARTRETPPRRYTPGRVSPVWLLWWLLRVRGCSREPARWPPFRHACGCGCGCGCVVLRSPLSRLARAANTPSE